MTPQSIYALVIFVVSLITMPIVAHVSSKEEKKKKKQPKEQTDEHRTTKRTI